MAAAHDHGISRDSDTPGQGAFGGRQPSPIVVQALRPNADNHAFFSCPTGLHRGESMTSWQQSSGSSMSQGTGPGPIGEQSASAAELAYHEFYLDDFEPRSHYRPLWEHIRRVGQNVLGNKVREADLALRTEGVTFTVY